MVKKTPTTNSFNSFKKTKTKKANKMKKIYSFLAMVFLVGMASPVLAQENPCATLGKPVFTLTENAGVCTASFSIYVKNDVSNANPKKVLVEYFFADDPLTIVDTTCFTAAVGGAEYQIPDFIYDCSETLKYRVTQFTASNGKCQGGTCDIVLVLPLKLIKFSAYKKNQSVQLDWLVDKDVVEDGEYFELERSIPGGTFSSVQKIDARVSVGNYSYTDNTISTTTGKFLYRLAMINNTGKKEYSNQLPVSFGSGIKPKIISETGSGKILLSDMPPGTLVRVISTAGVVLFNDVKVLGTTSMDITNAPKGMYIVKYWTKDEFGYVKIIR